LASVEGVTAVPGSVGAFGSLTSLALPDGVTSLPESVGNLASLTSLTLPAGVSPLPASGCTAELAAIVAFAYHCLSGAERAAALSVTTAAAEVEALLDFCSANPGISFRSTPICGSGITMNQHWSLDLWEDRVQWGTGDPCAGDRWYGVTCDAAGEHVTAMCALLPRWFSVLQPPLTRGDARAEIWRVPRA